MNFWSFAFKTPIFGWLFLLIPLILLVYFLYTKKKERSLNYSSTELHKFAITPNWRMRLSFLPMLIRVVVLCLIIFTLMRPQETGQSNIKNVKAIDIMILMDISDTMKYPDFSPNRLEVAKKTAIEFINKRPSDRIGLVVFGKEAFLQSPLTFDQDLLKSFLKRITFIKDISQKTAIGSAIISGVLSLKNSTSKSKVIILITDGENNVDNIDPFTAAEIAKKFNIKIYSIGIGRPNNDPALTLALRYQIPLVDETSLKKISSISGGHYFNVQNSQKFTETYSAIDKLEKTKITQNKYQQFKDTYSSFIRMILGLLLLDFLLSYFILRKF